MIVDAFGTQRNPAERLFSLSKGARCYFVPDWLVSSLEFEALSLFWESCDKVSVICLKVAASCNEPSSALD